MKNTHPVLTAIILGIVEGLTEFLPNSSTAHIMIVSYILGFKGNIAKIFGIVIQSGAILAAIVIFRQQVFSLIDIDIHFSYSSQDKKTRLYPTTLCHILLSIFPTIILGCIFHDIIIKLLLNPVSVISALTAGSILLSIAELLKPKIPKTRKLSDITYKQAFFIGCFQSLALWPGFSRSGATISGGILIGMNRCVAFEFSFLSAIPLLIGTTVFSLYENISFLTMENILMFTIGFITSFIVALCVVKFFLQIIKQVSLIPFVIYRFIITSTIYQLFF